MIFVVRIVHDLPPPWTISYFDLTRFGGVLLQT